MSGFDYTPEIDEQIRTMWADGKYSTRDIADTLGLRRTQIIGRIDRKRKEEGEDRWRKDDWHSHFRKAAVSKGVKRAWRRRRSASPYSAERPEPVSTTTQRPFVNPEPPRESVKPIRFSLRALNQCAFIEGEADENALCCGAPVVEGTSWCPHHLARVTIERKKSTGHFRLMGLEAA